MMPKLTRDEIVDRFAKFNVTLHPAGIWRFNSAGSKEPEVAFRADNLPLSKYPKDNMLKLRIEETPYMVIDIDAPDAKVLMELYANLPSIKNTLTTTTTAETKQHVYIVRPEDFPLTRIVGALKNVDILSNGVVFEGHLYNINEHYDIENDKIVTLKPHEVDYLMSLVPKDLVKYGDKQIANKRFNPAEKKLIEEYVNGTIVDERKLWKALTSKSEHKQGRSDYALPELSYDTFNTMAFYVALNEYIPHEMVIKFLEKVLTKEYGINLSSKQTQQRFYKQILPTLPVYEIDDKNDSFEAHIAKAPVSRDGRFLLVSTIDQQGGQKFVLLDKYTLLPQSVNGTVLRTQKAVQFLFPTLDSDTYTYGVPQIELTSNPYQPHTAYDFDRGVFTLNTLRPTQYMQECGELVDKPDNVLTRAIANIFMKTEEATSSVDTEDFYYHWLAHVIFSERSLVTILSLSTDTTVQGGTGKSTFAAKLPMHILPRGTVFAVDESSAGWGDAFHNSKLTCFDDLYNSDKWAALYTKMKQETSGTISKKNIKGGAMVITEASASLAISSNFLPKIDETDRRFFIWSPTAKLSQDEGFEISKMMADFNAYHQDIQDIVSYCKYLYTHHRDKYAHELYIEAPKTSFNSIAKTEGATGKKLLSIILNGPNTLFDSFVPNKQIAFSKTEIVEMILLQTSEPNNRSNGKYMLHLPQDFCKMLLNATRDEDMLNESPRNIALALGCTFSSIAPQMQGYKENKKCDDWVTRGVRMPIDPEVVAKYQAWLKYNGPIDKAKVVESPNL